MTKENEKLHDRFDEEVGMKVVYPKQVKEQLEKAKKEKEVEDKKK